MRILVDIGGTYIRLAKEQGGQHQDIQKYEAADFKNLGEALEQYCGDEKGELLIAAAGADNNGNWTITNNPDWSMDAGGWDVKCTLNDFEAIAHALPVLESEDLNTLKEGNSSNQNLCVIGVGTGLGLAYNRGGIVQKTHGGHMPIASLNDEHGKFIKSLRENQSRAVIFEDIVSGQADFANTNPKLFHEFLGIFTATALVTGNAYGGLYLTGGVIEGLIEEDKFDFETFNEALCFDAAPVVKTDIENTPIHIITDPYPALKGLINAQSLSDN